jgi:hypothetical protein
MPMVFRLQHKIMSNLDVRCLRTLHQNQVHEGGQQGTHWEKRCLFWFIFMFFVL